MKASFAFLLLIFSLSCSEEAKTKNPASTTTQKVEKKDPPKRVPPPNVVYDEGAMPSQDAVLGEAGGEKVTLEDFEFASKLALVAAKDGTTLPPDRMAMPHIHFTMTQSILSRRVAAKKAKERGIKVSKEETMAWLSKQKTLNHLIAKDADTAALLKPFGITVDQVLQFARYEVFVEKFVASELESVKKEEIWKAYSAEYNRVVAIIGSAHNVPTGAEIDAFAQAEEKQIAEYFEKNKRTFRSPKRVKIDLLRLKKGADKKNLKPLEDAAAALGKGERIEEIAKKFDLELNLDRKLIHKENKTAFKAKPGTSGFVTKGPRGAYAWIVRGFIASEEGKLGRSVKREISAKILRTKAISPALVERLQLAKEKVLKKVTEKNAQKAGKKLADFGLRWRVSNFADRGAIKEFGLVENLVNEAFKNEKGFIGGPLKSREYAYIYKILKREYADRKVFDKKYDEFRVGYLQAKRGQVMPMFMSQFTNTDINTKPLRIKWGVYRKKR